MGLIAVQALDMYGAEASKLRGNGWEKTLDNATTQQGVHETMKVKNIKKTVWKTTSPHGNDLDITDPLFVEFTGDRWIPLAKGLWCKVLMFSSLLAWTIC